LAGRQRQQKKSIFDKDLHADSDKHSTDSQKKKPTPTAEPVRNFYLEYVKINESMRKSGGLGNYGGQQVEQRRSSYSQGRAKLKEKDEHRKSLNFNLVN
jgi:hypothetical protein